MIMNQMTVLNNLCRHKALVGEIFKNRMMIQSMSDFNDLEQEGIERLISVRMVRKDGEDNIWLSPSFETALEELLDMDENFYLGKISDYLKIIDKNISKYIISNKNSQLNAIVKNFNNIVIALEDNAELVVRKKSVGFKSAFNLKEKMHYLEDLQKDIIELKKQISGIEEFTQKKKRYFNNLAYAPLNSKRHEVEKTIDIVRSTLSVELEDIIITLQKIAKEDRTQKVFLKKLRAIEHLKEHGRLSETNIEDVVKKILYPITLDVKTQLNARYIYSEEYSERILIMLDERGSEKKVKREDNQEVSFSSTDNEALIDIFIDINELYPLFLKSNNITLIRFIENVIDQVEIKNPDAVIDLYLEIIENYHRDLDIENCLKLEKTKDNKFSVLALYPIQKNKGL